MNPTSTPIDIPVSFTGTVTLSLPELTSALTSEEVAALVECVLLCYVQAAPKSPNSLDKGWANTRALFFDKLLKRTQASLGQQQLLDFIWKDIEKTLPQSIQIDGEWSIEVKLC